MLGIIGIFAGILSAISYIPYIKDTLWGTTKPERSSWLIWSVLTSIAFFSLVAKGATASLWEVGVEALCVTIVFFLSLRFGVGGTNKRDIIVLCIAVLGLVLWYVTKEAAIALFISIGIDASGTILTVIKAYQDPGSETLTTWVLVCISGLLAMIAVGSFNITLLSYPFYIFAANGITALAMILGGRKKKKHH